MPFKARKGFLKLRLERAEQALTRVCTVPPSTSGLPWSPIFFTILFALCFNSPSDNLAAPISFVLGGAVAPGSGGTLL